MAQANEQIAPTQDPAQQPIVPGSESTDSNVSDTTPQTAQAAPGQTPSSQSAGTMSPDSDTANGQTPATQSNAMSQYNNSRWTPGSNTTQPQPQPWQQYAAQPHPAAGRVFATAQELTGGPRYTTTIDPNTGVTTRTPVPVSGRSVGLALALEALAGGFAGAGAHGPNAVGQAAQLGLQKGEQIAQQRTQQQQDQDKQAQQDIANQQAVVRNNLQTRQLAMSLGRQSLEDAQESVKADSDAWTSAQEDPTNIYGRDLTHDQAYAQLNKIGVGKAQVLITGVVPRRDPKTGEPLAQMPNGTIVPQGTPGSYTAPDFTYAVVKPDTPITMVGDDGKLLPQYSTAAARHFIAVNGDGSMPSGYKTTAKDQQAALRGSQNAGLTLQEAQSVNPQLSETDFNAALTDPTVRNGLNIYQSVLNQGGTHAQAMDQVTKSKFAGSAGVINGFYGGKANTDVLDQKADNTHFENGVRAGVTPLDNPQAIARARASSDPKVKASGDAAQRQNEQDVLRQERQKEGVSVSGQEQVAKFKNDLANQGGDENPNFNEAPNAQGVRQNYLNSLPNADEVRQIGQGDRALPMDRSTQSVALRRQVSRAFPNYNQANYPAWQKLKVAYTSGPQSKGVNALNQALLHGAEAYNNVTVGSTIPGLSSVERWSGNDQANGYNAAIDAFASELGTAVKGGVLDQADADRWIADVRGSNPASARSKIRTTMPLLKARLDTLQQTLNGASVAGTAPIQVLHGDAAHAYDVITGTQSGQGGSQGQQTVPNGMIPARINGQVVGYKNPTTGQVTRF